MVIILSFETHPGANTNENCVCQLLACNAQRSLNKLFLSNGDDIISSCNLRSYVIEKFFEWYHKMPLHCKRDLHWSLFLCISVLVFCLFSSVRFFYMLGQTTIYIYLCVRPFIIHTVCPCEHSDTKVTSPIFAAERTSAITSNCI